MNGFQHQQPVVPGRKNESQSEFRQSYGWTEYRSRIDKFLPSHKLIHFEENR